MLLHSTLHAEAQRLVLEGKHEAKCHFRQIPPRRNQNDLALVPFRRVDEQRIPEGPACLTSPTSRQKGDIRVCIASDSRMREISYRGKMRNQHVTVKQCNMLV